MRFTAREFVRIHHHAALTGTTLTDFGRTVMLRRPRPRRKHAPAIVALPPKRLARWTTLGNALNQLAHDFNARHQLDARRLTVLLRSLRLHLRCCFPDHFHPDIPVAAYMLAPAVRYHLRKVCTNLVQLADRYRLLGLTPPLPLSNLIARFRCVLNGDAAAHGP
jgi:hypothetical protein